MSGGVTDLRDKIGAKPVAHTVRWFNLMVYGDPGVGKTKLGSTAQDVEEFAPMLIIDTEGGLATIAERDDIDAVEVKSVKAMNELFASLHEDFQHEKPTYRTLMLDSLTEFQKVDLADIMQDAVAKNAREDKDVASQRSWGITINHVRALVRGFRDLPCHTIFTALAKTDQDADKTIITSPNLPGKLAGEIPGFLDVMGYLYVDLERGKGVRKLQVQPTRRTKAKDRLGITDQSGVMENPTVPELWSHYMNRNGDNNVTHSA
jgi:phage nucleotide-binding protein